MTDIKIYNTIAEEGLNLLKRNDFTLNQTDDPDGILLRSENLHTLHFNHQLKGIARAGAGVNNIPIDKCSEQGIVVFNTPGANANAVCELVIGAMIVEIRHMILANEWAQTLTGDDIGEQVEAGKKQFNGTELKGKTLGIIGLGSVGHLVANAAVELGMAVVGYDPYIKKDARDKLNYHIKRTENVAEVYQQADFLTIHVPATSDNDQMIDATVFKQMKPDSILLNFSRGQLVDEAALIAALNQGEIKKYVTDFPTAATVMRDDCLVFPHLGASTAEAETTCAVMAAEQLSDFLLTGNIKNAVNFPNVEMPLESATRLAIVNRNIPNVINLLVTKISTYNINIDYFINKSQGHYAYTLIDIDEDDPEILANIHQKIAEELHILSVRIIKNKHY